MIKNITFGFFGILILIAFSIIIIVDETEQSQSLVLTINFLLHFRLQIHLKKDY